MNGGKPEQTMEELLYEISQKSGIKREETQTKKPSKKNKKW